MIRRLALAACTIGGVALAGCAGNHAATSATTSNSATATTSTTASNSTTSASSTGSPAMFKSDPALRLGNFSVSLAVKDLAASKAFYEKLGFVMVGGNGKNWAVMRNENTKIGLFQGMFDKNTLTFNPGWDSDRNTLPDFVDVRELQHTLQGRGVTLTSTADETKKGPAFFTLTDPDGNPILVDQHVGK